MKLISFFLVINIFICLNASTNSSNSNSSSDVLRLLIIGDSVDRYAIEDWCAKSNNNSYLFTERSSLATLASSNTVQDLLKPFGQRRKAWEIRVCERQILSTGRVIYVAFLFNKLGVKPRPFWHTPLATMGGLARYDFHNTSESFRVGIAPAVVPIVKAMGGQPHGVLLNSVFWDLSHLYKEMEATYIRENSNSTTTENAKDTDTSKFVPKRSNIDDEEWLGEWFKNASLLMEVVKETFPHSSWFGWRRANTFHPVVKGHWNTFGALRQLLQMEKRVPELCEKGGYELISFSVKSSQVSLRDVMHPTSQYLIELLDLALKKTNSSRLRRMPTVSTVS